MAEALNVLQQMNENWEKIFVGILRNSPENKVTFSPDECQMFAGESIYRLDNGNVTITIGLST